MTQSINPSRRFSHLPNGLWRLKTEYNLEKPPLQSGVIDRADGHGVRALQWLGQDGHHRTWLVLALWFVALTLVIGIATAVLLSQIETRSLLPYGTADEPFQSFTEPMRGQAVGTGDNRPAVVDEILLGR